MNLGTICAISKPKTAIFCGSWTCLVPVNSPSNPRNENCCHSSTESIRSLLKGSCTDVWALIFAVRLPIFFRLCQESFHTKTSLLAIRWKSLATFWERRSSTGTVRASSSRPKPTRRMRLHMPSLAQTKALCCGRRTAAFTSISFTACTTA